MHFFYHMGKAYPYDGPRLTPEALASFHIKPYEPAYDASSGICAHCAKRPCSIYGSDDYHCKACRRTARLRHANPSFTARFPVGHWEPQAMDARADWIDRFRSKIEASDGPDACHTWTGSVSNTGYGAFGASGHNHLAHRLSYLLAGGQYGHPVVLHSCDNPRCVNPAHLRGGTISDNARDMVAKGRNTPSRATHLKDRERHPRAKRIMTPKGEFPSATLAAEAFGITKVTVSSRALRGDEGWSYL